MRQIDQAFNTTTSSPEWRQERFGGRKDPSIGSIAQLTIWKGTFTTDKTRNPLFEHRREREMDGELCGERDPCGKKASLIRRDSNYATVGRYEKCWNGRIANQKACKTIWGDVVFYRRQSERTCNFRWCWGWGRGGRWWRGYRVWATWVKMTNPARWWAPSPKWYSNPWRDFGRSRWGLTNWRNRDVETWPTTPVREIWSTGWLNWGFQPLSTLKQIQLQPHHQRQHLDIICRLMILSQEYHKCRKGLLDQEVVKSDWVLRKCIHTNT